MTHIGVVYEGLFLFRQTAVYDAIAMMCLKVTPHIVIVVHITVWIICIALNI